ncbi:MAG: hypothetical protein DRN96_01890 [Thermoproteota archaeon]|nr:MAG: hypothetical protein DRN96_01890 [Candidatus Korarchaeota archaeon]RLG55922.1 MAG: hypothetical protein DRN99_01130 [Candidatus Korarchaeota archaeon]
MPLEEEFVKLIKDPVHGYVPLTEAEIRVIDTQVFQRLRRIQQLAGSNYVYPGATHTRFEHSLGVLHLAGIAGKKLSKYMSEDDVQLIRLAALLHDVGHGPFSHSFEPFLEKKTGLNHEHMSKILVEKTEIGDILEDYGFSKSEVSTLCTGMCSSKPQFMNQIIRSAIDVDKLDFVVRDSLHTGAGYGSIDIYRIIYNMDVIEEVLSLDEKALPALETLLIGRMEAFRAIYFHKTSRAVQLMINMALEQVEDEISREQLLDPKFYCSLDDYTTWVLLKKHQKAGKIIERLEARKLLKAAYERTMFLRDRYVVTLFRSEAVRNKLREELSAESGVPIERIIIDTPTLPTVPYHWGPPSEDMRIPLHRRVGGEVIQIESSSISELIDFMKRFMNIIRVYSFEEDREKVRKAAIRVLGSTDYSLAVSY